VLIAHTRTKVSTDIFVQQNTPDPWLNLNSELELNGLRGAAASQSLANNNWIGMASKKTAIVTGTSQGIGAAVVPAFLDRGYNRRSLHCAPPDFLSRPVALIKAQAEHQQRGHSNQGLFGRIQNILCRAIPSYLSDQAALCKK
jgi:hypothetical protein